MGVTDARLGLFEGIGVELEYMIVDRDTLAVRPVADALMRLECEEAVSEVERGPIAWSNELVLHVVELKTNGPAPDLRGLAARFHAEVGRINAHLERLGARLMPGGMHPFMDPSTETHLWPHEHNEVYRTFDRIFGCGSHGWSNLQSTHLNLPFSTDGEFARLHAAGRAVIPLVPALAASSPYHDGKRAADLDGRVAMYRANSTGVPSVAGLVVPEVATSREQYEREILGRIYRDLEPHDPEGVLRHEWVNARGAIARFGRGSIEIRLIDAQEGPRADLAVAAAVLAAVRWLCEDPPAGWTAANSIGTEELSALLAHTVRSGDAATIASAEYLRIFGLHQPTASASDVWRHIIRSSLDALPGASEWADELGVILEQGCLARRIVRSVGPETSRARMAVEYERLCTCLEEGEMYTLKPQAGRAP